MRDGDRLLELVHRLRLQLPNTQESQQWVDASDRGLGDHGSSSRCWIRMTFHFCTTVPMEAEVSMQSLKPNGSYDQCHVQPKGESNN
uniref:Uncharacterized protein n=1 Tax=Oryza barthii TaxID=65489 RepID=A0A0D3EZ22_9ORYZ